MPALALSDLLACPICGSLFLVTAQTLACRGCGQVYPRRPHLDLLAPVRRPPNEGPGDTAEMARRRQRWEQRALRRDVGECQALARYIDAIVPHLRPGAVALDLGCGTGLVLREVGRRLSAPLLLAGLDISRPMLHTAARTLRGEPRAMVFRASSRRRLPLHDGACDVVLRRLAPALLDEVARVLAPGGAYVTASFGATHWRELYDALPDLPRPRQERRDAPLDLLPAAGFALVDQQAWHETEALPAAEALERILLGPAGFHVNWERDLPRLQQRIAGTGDTVLLTTDVRVMAAVKVA